MVLPVIILVMLIRILRDLQCVSVESNYDDDGDDGDGDDDDGDAVDDDRDGVPNDDHERLVMRQWVSLESAPDGRIFYSQHSFRTVTIAYKSTSLSPKPT